MPDIQKVRFGGSHVMYALYDGDTLSYGEWMPLAGSVQFSFEPQGSQNTFYADNVAYYTSSPNASDTGSIELADVTTQAKKDLLGWKESPVNGITYEPSNAKHSNFAIAYQVEGNGDTLRGVKYNCTLDRPSETHNTETDSNDPDTITLNYTCIGRDFSVGGEVENVLGAYCTSSENPEAYAAWFQQVITPATEVTTVEPAPEAPDARLSALTVGSLALTPSFDPDVSVYAAETTNATNTVAATPADDDAEVTITVNGAALSTGGTATWEEGANVVTVTVTNGASSAAYVVTVTKS